MTRLRLAFFVSSLRDLWLPAIALDGSVAISFPSHQACEISFFVSSLRDLWLPAIALDDSVALAFLRIKPARSVAASNSPRRLGYD
ncbi:hypothetical protein J6590_006950 [Homalodisca vitripennis]|nr:hypothetical protein J6590_006950 [Homalodisca vitripennis]